MNDANYSSGNDSSGDGDVKETREDQFCPICPENVVGKWEQQQNDE